MVASGAMQQDAAEEDLAATNTVGCVLDIVKKASEDKTPEE